MVKDKTETRRLLEVLRTVLRILGVSNREVERRLELNNSTITRVFSGQVEAKLDTVLGIVRAIGLGYDEFFALAYPERRSPSNQSEASRKVRALLEELRPMGKTLAQEEPAAPAGRVAAASPLSREELAEDLQKAVREILEGMNAKAGSGS
jgi:transcriptional regulator with XRE-family HTH domain